MCFQTIGCIKKIVQLWNIFVYIQKKTNSTSKTQYQVNLSPTKIFAANDNIT